jgi:ataxin-3
MLWLFFFIGDYYSPIDLADIAQDLDRQEMAHMYDPSTIDTMTTPQTDSSNYDDSGFFSIQVIQKALSAWSLELIPYKSQNQIALHAQAEPTSQNAYICNFKQHWYTIRKFGCHWFNLNSMLKRPQYVSETFLSILLAQLVNDGYSIFICHGQLAQCEADVRIASMSHSDILAFARETSEYMYENTDDNESTQAGHTSSDANDPELMHAIKMSLEHDENTENKEKTYRDLLQSTQADYLSNEDEELRRAIEMSLYPSLTENPATIATAVTITIPEKSTNVDEVRRKRLEYLNKSNQ